MFSYSIPTLAPLAPLTLEFQTFKLFNRFAPFNSPSFVLPRSCGRTGGFERLEPFERLERAHSGVKTPRNAGLVYPNAPISCMLASKVIF